MMNLPTVITELVSAQNTYSSVAYAACFSEKAVVFDEGHRHTGRTEIQNWIAEANRNYKTLMKPLKYEAFETESILTAEISGDFDGSPIVLKYHFQLDDTLIHFLKISS